MKKTVLATLLVFLVAGFAGADVKITGQNVYKDGNKFWHEGIFQKTNYLSLDGSSTMNGDLNMSSNRVTMPTVLNFYNSGAENISKIASGMQKSDSATFIANYTGSENSALRLYIEDNPEDSFQIWGDSCSVGNCQNLLTSAKNFEFWGSGNLDIYRGILDMNGNQIKTTSCPSGMVNVNNDFCIENSDRSSVYWSEAVAACRADGYRLPTYQDMIAACDAGAISNTNGLWMSNLFNDDDAFYANSDCASSPPFNFEGTTGSGGMQSNKAFRCVYEP